MYVSDLFEKAGNRRFHTNHSLRYTTTALLLEAGTDEKGTAHPLVEEIFNIIRSYYLKGGMGFF